MCVAQGRQQTIRFYESRVQRYSIIAGKQFSVRRVPRVCKLIFDVGLRRVHVESNFPRRKRRDIDSSRITDERNERGFFLRTFWSTLRTNNKIIFFVLPRAGGRPQWNFNSRLGYKTVHLWKSQWAIIPLATHNSADRKKCDFKFTRESVRKMRSASSVTRRVLYIAPRRIALCQRLCVAFYYHLN